MRTGMLAAAALRDVLFDAAGEAEAFADYQRQCQKAFLASFWAAKLVHKVVSSPVPDWMMMASEQPAMKRITGRLMAQM
jgi:hypothetical protein